MNIYFIIKLRQAIFSFKLLWNNSGEVFLGSNNYFFIKTKKKSSGGVKKTCQKYFCLNIIISQEMEK